METILDSKWLDLSAARRGKTIALAAIEMPRLPRIVSTLADKIWKGQRQEDLEQLLIQRIVAATGDEPWNVFIRLDDLLNRIAAQAEGRLHFQAQFAVSSR